MKTIFLVLTLMISHAVMAKGPDVAAEVCNTRLQKKQAIQKAGQEAVAKSLQRLRDLGLKKLLSDFDNGDVKVKVKTPWLPMMQDPVSGEISVLNQKYLMIRRVDVSTPEREQLFTWRIALALFELQTEPALWSNAAVFPEDLPVNEDARTVWSRVPKAWANEKVALTKDLMNELYTLFMNCPDIKPGTIMPATDKTGELYAAVHDTLGINNQTAMPANDPGLYWKIKAAILRDASQDIGPNTADYRRWLISGREPMDQAIDQRHARSTLFNYYMNHVKRMLMVTSLLTTLAWSPNLLMIPSYIQTHNIDVERSHQLDTAALRNDDIERKGNEIFVENQIQEINASITAEQNSEHPNQQTIANLKTTLQAVIDKNPGSVYMTSNSPAAGTAIPH
jgi:hypothetical protein